MREEENMRVRDDVACWLLTSGGRRIRTRTYGSQETESLHSPETTAKFVEDLLEAGMEIPEGVVSFDVRREGDAPGDFWMVQVVGRSDILR
jgi:hypothetical protein